MSESRGFHLRPMSSDNRDEVLRLIFHSTNRYYASIGREPIFKGDELSPADIFDVYARIDPGEGIVAVDDQLNHQAGRCPVLLVPVSCGDLVRQLYDWGARNCELHVAQSCGPAQAPAGVVMPTFLPESG